MSQRVQVEAPCDCRWVVPKCSIPTLLGNILITYQAYQELGDHYNDRSWYWTISRINDLVAKYPDLFEDGAIRTEMERLESQWMVEQDLSDKEQLPLLLSLKKRVRSQQRKAWQELRKPSNACKGNQKRKQNKGSRWTRKSALQDLDDEEDATYEEKIDLVDFDYDYILATGLFGATLLAIVIYLIRSKETKREENKMTKIQRAPQSIFFTVCRNWLGVWTRSSFSTRI